MRKPSGVGFKRKPPEQLAMDEGRLKMDQDKEVCRTRCRKPRHGNLACGSAV